MPACLVLDVRLPGKSGLDFQRELAAANIQLPIIFITGHGDIPMTVQAIKEGAVEFLTKPFREQELLDAIELGLEKDRVRRKKETALGDLRERFETLTPREREILIHVVRGRVSKQIAADFGISETTVKLHRSNLTHLQQFDLPSDWSAIAIGAAARLGTTFSVRINPRW